MTKASCISKVSISFTRHKEDSEWSKLRKRHLKSVVQDIRLIQKQLTIRGHIKQFVYCERNPIDGKANK